MTDRNIIGQKISFLRKAKGLTQAELAEKLGVSPQAVSQWERNETLPDILTLPRLAEIFGENINALLGIEETKIENVPVTDEVTSEETEEDKSDDENTVPILSERSREWLRLIAKKNDIENTVTIPEVRVPEINIPEIHLPDGEVIAAQKIAEQVIPAQKISIPPIPEVPPIPQTQKNVCIDTGDFTLPVSEHIIDFDDPSEEFEIAIVKDGKIVNKFKGTPDRFVRLVINGTVGQIRSSVSVEVNGDVNEHAESGFDMTINGDVYGDPISHMGMTCGNVNGNASAGMSLKCENIEGNAAAGMTINCGHIAGEKKAAMGVNEDGEENHDVKIEIGCGNVTVNGDYDGDLSTAASITVYGSINGNVDSEGSVNVYDGDINGDVDASDGVTAEGDINGDVDAGDGVNAGGDINGDVDAGDGVNAGGDINGDVNAGDDVNVGGDIIGDADSDGDINVGGDVNGNIDTDGNATITGNVEGDINADGNVTVQGDANGDIEAERVKIYGNAKKND